MVEGDIYDVVRDIEGRFSPEFRKYVFDENLLCHKFTKDGMLGNCDVWLFRKEQQLDGVESADPDLTNRLLTMFETIQYVPSNCLFQFWRAEEVTSGNDFGERRFIHTTRNQPFLISGSELYEYEPIREAICYYRRNMVSIVDEDGGVIGRVFQTNRMEFTPNIRFYSYEEHPFRDLARYSDIESSLAIPLSDPSGLLVGVLEIVSEFDLYCEQFCCELQDSGSLKYFRQCEDLCGQCDLENKSLHIAVSEIKEVMKAVGESHDIVCGQTWMLCNNCGSLSTSANLDYKLDASYSNHSVSTYGRMWSVAEYLCTLKTGEGVVGKAAISSHNLVYCEDVSQFSITHYPLAHFSRTFHLKPCLAICLKSVLTGRQIYVLELFLNPSKVNGIGLTDTLLPILDGMRLNFRTFKLASGEEIGDNLYVQVIDARLANRSQLVKIGGIHSMENRNHAQVCNDQRVNVVGISQQPLVQDNVVHTEENGLKKKGFFGKNMKQIWGFQCF